MKHNQTLFKGNNQKKKKKKACKRYWDTGFNPNVATNQ